MNAPIISIIIFAAVIILFLIDKLPSATVALMGLTAMLAFKCCTVEEALSGFASDTFLLLLGMLIVGEALFSSGAAEFIGYYAIKFSNDNERRFIIISCIISAVMSAFLTNTAVIAMLMAICLSASAESKNMKYRNLVIPVAIAAIAGGHCTLVGSTTQLTANGLLRDAAGLEFGMWDLLKVCGPITIVLILYMAFIGYPQGKKIWGDREENYSNAKAIDAGKAQLTTKGKIALVIFGIIVVLFITNVFKPGITSMIGALLCILTGCITQKDAFKKIDWNTIVWLCSCLGIGKALNASGGAKIIAGGLLNLFDESTFPMLFFAAMVLVAMVLSELMSNMACLLIIMPATLQLAMANGINPYTIAYGMCLGAALTYATPLANGHIGMTMSAGYKFSDYIRYGLGPSVIAYVMVVFLTPVFYPL